MTKKAFWTGKELNKRVKFVGGGVGSATGTFITENLNNIDKAPEDRKSFLHSRGPGRSVTRFISPCSSGDVR